MVDEFDTSHVERIMTARARARARAMARSNATRNFVTKNFLSLVTCDADIERADFFSGLGCGCTRQLSRQNCLIFVDLSDSAYESVIRGTIRVRGEVIKSTLIVNNVHSLTVVFISLVNGLCCTVCSSHSVVHLLFLGA